MTDTRLGSKEADAHLGVYHKILDEGFVALVDYMGNDQSVEQAARVSYGGGTRKVSDTRNLIRYLVRNHHTSPLEMCELKFHMKMPIFVARQIVRHRTASLNEVSGRYSKLPDDTYIPEDSQLTKQATNNKQGRSDELVEADYNVKERLQEQYDECFGLYDELLELGLSRELSRITLPLSTYTEWFWKIDLHNLFHFLRLRLDSHAQYETRVYAEVMADITKALFPICYEAFEDYRLNSMSLTGTEIQLIRELTKSGWSNNVSAVAEKMTSLSKREVNELKQKLGRIDR